MFCFSSVCSGKATGCIWRCCETHRLTWTARQVHTDKNVTILLLAVVFVDEQLTWKKLEEHFYRLKKNNNIVTKSFVSKCGGKFFVVQSLNAGFIH